MSERAEKERMLIVQTIKPSMTAPLKKEAEDLQMVPGTVRIRPNIMTRPNIVTRPIMNIMIHTEV